MNREAELASVKQQITKYTNTVAKLGTKLNKAKEKREKYTSNKKKEQKYGRKVQQLQEHLTQQEGLLTSLLIKEDRLEKAADHHMLHEADPDMQKFLQALEENKDSFTDLLTKGSCTVTLKDAFFLGNPQVGSEVYVRLCYLAILEAHKLYEEKRPGIAKITIGTPGTGKTFLAALVVTKSLLEGKVVILQVVADPKSSNPAPGYFRFKLGELATQCDSYKAFFRDLWNRETIYVVDGGLPGILNFKAQCLVFASPQKQHFRLLQKDHFPHKAFYMPLWSGRELQLCRRSVAAYSGLSEQLVEELFWIAGGVARTIFKEALVNNLTPEELVKQLIQKVQTLSSSQLERIITAIGNKHFPLGSDKILHWVVSEGGQALPAPSIYSPDSHEARRFTQQSLQFASAFVAAVVGVYRHQLLEKMSASFVLTHSGNYEFGSAAGQQFERLAHARLAMGGTFSVTLLGSNKEYKLNLPLSDPQGFSSIAAAATTAAADMKTYLIPFSETCPAIDSLRSPALFFQVTTGATHSLALEPLQHLIQAMQNDQQKFRQAVDFVNKSLVRSSVDGPPKQKKQRVQLLQHKPLLLFVVPTESLYLWKKVQTYTINKKKAPGDPQPVLQGVIGIDVRQMSQPNYLDVARAAAAQIAGWHNTSSMAPATAGARM